MTDQAGGQLARVLATVRPADDAAIREARARQDRLTKPRGALGVLEDVSVRLAGVAGTCPPPFPAAPAVAVFAGDHGVHAQGVTPWPQEVTAQMVGELPRRRRGRQRARPAGWVRASSSSTSASPPSLPAADGAVVPPGAPRHPRPHGRPGDDPRRGGRRRRGRRSPWRTAWSTEGADCLLTGDMGIANTTAVRRADRGVHRRGPGDRHRPRHRGRRRRRCSARSAAVRAGLARNAVDQGVGRSRPHGRARRRRWPGARGTRRVRARPAAAHGSP